MKAYGGDASVTISLGSPKYIPPVSSLTIKISNPSIIWFFIGDAAASSLNRNAGLKLANSSSSFLNARRAYSGLSSQERSSHFGPPTAPNNIASDFFASSRTLSGKGEP